jgi:hypothetical protein
MMNRGAGIGYQRDARSQKVEYDGYLHPHGHGLPDKQIAFHPRFL